MRTLERVQPFFTLFEFRDFFLVHLTRSELFFHVFIGNNKRCSVHKSEKKIKIAYHSNLNPKSKKQ